MNKIIVPMPPCPCPDCKALPPRPPLHFRCEGCDTEKTLTEFECGHCDWCDMCCECWTCRACGRVHGEDARLCNNCDRCERCCACRQCTQCDYLSADADEFFACCGACNECGCQCAARMEEEQARFAAMAKQRQEGLWKKWKEAKAKLEMTKRPLSPLMGPDGKQIEGVLVNAQGLQFFPATQTQHAINPSDRFISAELEIADIDHATRANGDGLMRSTGEHDSYQMRDKTLERLLTRKWPVNLTWDQSLPSLSGFEINTAPASGDRFVEQINDICEVLHARNAKSVNVIDRDKFIRCCSTHIHVDARDFLYMTLRKLLFLYEKVEPVLFEMLPGYRRKSHFCRPLGPLYCDMIRNFHEFVPGSRKKPKSGDVARRVLIQAVYRAPVADRSDKRSCSTSVRYSALNLHAFWFRGTLEFRHLHGTTDREEITNWGILCASLLDAAKGHKEREILEACSKMTPLQTLKWAVPAKLVPFIDHQLKRFSVEQLIMESPRLNAVPSPHLKYYAEGDVMVSPRREEGKMDIGDILRAEGLPRLVRPAQPYRNVRVVGGQIVFERDEAPDF
jgi:hypothetical protein